MMTNTQEGFTTNANDLDRDIAKKPKVLVLFFTQNCGYCKDLKPAWESAQEQLPDLLTSIDCTNGEDPGVKAVMKKYNVGSFPYMVFFNNAVVQEEYTGPRTTEDIIQYVKSKTG